MNMDLAEKTSELGFREYVEALEVERQKIEVFQRELPLCLELVTQTIERCKERLSSGAATTTEYLHRHQSDECNSEQTSSEGHHVFEEFIPLKKSSCSSDEEEDEEEEEEEHQSPVDNSTASKTKKRDWLRSVQLWSDPSSADPPQQESEKKEVRKNGGSPASSSGDATEGKAEASNNNNNNNKDNGQRKQRRNWSPELHKRFLNALQQLGGSHAATPKQIRELMKVDGLTNDEVKSHLQKYRLHTRRPAQNMANNGGSQAQQVVFMGGIWVQPSAGDSPGSGGIYAPVVRVGKGSGAARHSNSPATSSSTHTTTTSHAF